MNSINPASSPTDYAWDDAGLSGVFPERDSNQSRSQQQTLFQSYDGFPSITSPPGMTSNFGQDIHQFPSPKNVTGIEEIEPQNDDHQPIPAQTPQTTGRRTRYGNLDWDKHKSEMKRLYLDQDLSLKDTMRFMNENFSFPESAKLYKEKFKAWGWQKNLPGQYAQWMTKKATKRKRDDGKDTVFFYGGLKWDKSDAERSASRSKKGRNESEVILVDTPAEIEYKTPKNNAPSPENVQSPEASRPRKRGRIARGHVTFEAPVHSYDSLSEDESDSVQLSWQGHSRSDLIAIFDSARNDTLGDDPQKREHLFLTAFKGYGKIFGPSHEDTVKVGFALSSFYVEQDRAREADTILEEIAEFHVKKLGMENRRTHQVLMQIAELLNGWNRQKDALAFLSRFKDLLEGQTSSDDSLSTREGRVRRRKKIQGKVTGLDEPLVEIAREIIAEKNPSRIDDGIKLARKHVDDKNNAVEAFLQEIIKHCENDPGVLEIQGQQARNELLRLYIKLDRLAEQNSLFSNTIDIVKGCVSQQKWSKKNFKSFENMEALLGLTSSILKGGFEDEAYRLFGRIEAKADREFGWDDERTIWAKLTIGIIYQTHRNWRAAKPWFDHAYAASIAANGDEDGISMALELAKEKQHFSYLSDENRPFKTIFGVTGLVIRPNRLHLD